MIGLFIINAVCMNPVDFDPFEEYVPSRPAPASDDSPAALILTNMSKSVDVTKVTITQPEVSLEYAITFENQPARLEKKAQYLKPSDKSYHVLIEYMYDAYKETPEGTGSKNLIVPLPFPQETEIIIFRNMEGEVIIFYVDEYDGSNDTPDTEDTEEPEGDDMQGEGSSPAYIPEKNANKIAPFAVINKAKTQNVDIVEFRKGEKLFSMTGMNGPIKPNEANSIGLGKGSWNVVLKYTRDGEQFPLSITVLVNPDPLNPLNILNHCLYFYLKNDGNYGITQIWPPDDLDEGQMIPNDDGFGSGLIKIMNKSASSAKAVTIHNLEDSSIFPITIDYSSFFPPAPVKHQRTGYVDVIGTEDFPIDEDAEYLIQVEIEIDDTSDPIIKETTVVLYGRMVAIEILPEDIQRQNTRGATFIITNETTTENPKTKKGAEIIGMVIKNQANGTQRSYFGRQTWDPSGNITKDSPDNTVVQIVTSSTEMPIRAGDRFVAELDVYGGGQLEKITKAISPPELWSANSYTNNIRNITLEDADLSQEMINAIIADRDPNDPGSVGTKVKIENKTANYPVNITVVKIQNKSDTSKNYAYGSSSFMPRGRPIAKSGEANTSVINTARMPIGESDIFDAMLTVDAGGMEMEIGPISIQPDGILYSDDPNDPANPVKTITLKDEHIPQALIDALAYANRRASFKLNIKNSVSTWPVEIFSVKLINISDANQYIYYNVGTWEPGAPIARGGKAVQTVDCEFLRIGKPDSFKAEVMLINNQNNRTITKPLGVLYDSGDQYNLEIVDLDIPSFLRNTAPATWDSTWTYTMTFKNQTTQNYPASIVGYKHEKNVPDRGRAYSMKDFGGKIGPSRTYSMDDKLNHGAFVNTDDFWDVTFYLAANGKAGVFEPSKEGGSRYIYTGNESLRWDNINDNNWVPGTNQSWVNMEYTFYISEADAIMAIDSQGIGSGVTLTIENKCIVNEAEILSVKITNPYSDGNGITLLNPVTWDSGTTIKNGESTWQTVMSTADVPFMPTGQVSIHIQVLHDGKIYDATISYPTFYSTLNPEDNKRTITIDDSFFGGTPPPPPPPPTIKDIIKNAGVGDVIIIDGREWVKVKTEDYPGSAEGAALLLYNDIIPGFHRYNKNLPGPDFLQPQAYEGNFYRYNQYIRDIVDNWYSNLYSPNLKRMHMQLKVSDFKGPYLWFNNMSDFSKVKNDPASTPSMARDLIKAGTAGPDKDHVIAFVPTYGDIRPLKQAGKHFNNGYTFWLQDVVMKKTMPSGLELFWGAYTTWEYKWLLYVQPGGAIDYRSYDSQANVRPCVWVRLD